MSAQLDEIREQILYLLDAEKGRVWGVGEIADILGCHGSRAKLLKSGLASLAEEGVVKAEEKSRYRLAESRAGLMEGRLDVVRSGAGFVTDAASGRVIRVAAGDIGGAMAGDTVLVRPVKAGRDGETGRIIKITERSSKLVCATLSTIGGLFAVPINPSYQKDIELDDDGGAHDGDRVVVRLTSRDGTQLRGEIVDVIGPASVPSLDTETVCREYELPGPFPKAVLDEASGVDSLKDDCPSRLDLRDRFILTIDPAESKDFDDALSFQALPDGRLELGVHIADVSHYVRPGSELDREAMRRGNSVYLADKVIPMLPEALSNGICSLRPRADRKCFSVFIVYDGTGKVLSRRFAKSVIRSKLRLNYGQALAIIEGRRPDGMARVPAEARILLENVSALARRLRAIRMRNGALDLDIPECRVKLDADGMMTGFEIEEYDISHQMIEECMVAANEAVAAELSQHGWRIISRLHEPPDPLKISDLAATLRTMGFSPGDISNPANLSRFIASIEDHPLRAQAHTAILRSMKRALYSADGHGHFGLAKSRYSHFTSPIRRYADLILHRQLAAFVARRANPVPADFLAEAAAKCTETELRADEAERTLLEIKKYRFLAAQLESGEPEIYDAVIGKITSFGLFVDLDALAIGGLVHISTLSRQFVRFDKNGGQLTAGGRRWKLGQKVKVKVSRVDFGAKRLDFVLAN